MKKTIIIVISLLVFISSAFADMPGHLYGRVEPLTGYDYQEDPITKARVRLIEENGDEYDGEVYIYERGVHLETKNDERSYFLFADGAVLEKKGREKLQVTLFSGKVIVGKAASAVSGRMMYITTTDPINKKDFVMVFSKKYNYSSNPNKVKRLEIIEVLEISNELSTYFPDDYIFTSGDEPMTGEDIFE